MNIIKVAIIVMCLFVLTFSLLLISLSVASCNATMVFTEHISLLQNVTEQVAADAAKSDCFNALKLANVRNMVWSYSVSNNTVHADCGYCRED
jgi:MFS superfamily sulfate permease-like transporter